MIRVLACVGAVLLAVGGGSAARPRPSGVPSAGAAPVARAVPSVVGYAPPVTPLRVLRGFDPPATPYGPGHRGVDLGMAAGGVVRSAADGVVTFAGAVAGRGVVVVQHADGIRTEYEPLAPVVAAGDAVHRGDALGRLRGRHAGCGASACLHWGARRGEVYIDPLALLRPLGPVRLLPWPRDG